MGEEVHPVLAEGKFFLSVDESWCALSDFRQRKWQAAGTTNQVPTLSMVPRISLIVAISSIGRSYISITQSNSNSGIMDLYFTHLARLLDE